MTYIPMPDYLKSECELKSPLKVFLAIYTMSQGFPCKGCAYDQPEVDRPQGCPVKKELLKLVRPGRAREPKKPAPPTNAEIARKMKISKRQVSKLRKAGKLPEKYR
jgi:hypothetical protein